MTWKIEYYSDAVEEEIKALPRHTLAKFVTVTDRLTAYGPQIQRPICGIWLMGSGKSGRLPTMVPRVSSIAG